MTDKEKIRAYIDNQIALLEKNDTGNPVLGMSAGVVMAELKHLLTFIDSMQEEPEGNNEEISLLPVVQGFTSNLHWTTLKGGTLDWHDPETGHEVNIEKAYTNVEKSKKLAEILPLESYDMYWDLFDTAGRSYTPHLGRPISIDRDFLSFREGGVVPAWSLSALLELIPITCILSISNGHYRIASKETKTFFHNNPIDAAFEMVCWLKENGKI